MNRSKLLRSVIAELIDETDEMTVAWEQENFEGACRALMQSPPTVLLFETSGIDCTNSIRRFAEFAPETAIVLSGVELELERVVGYARAGAAGYVSPEAEKETWLAAIRGAVRGEVTNPAVAGLLNRYFHATGRGAAAQDDPPARVPSPHVAATAARVGLTPREREVLELIDAGRSNKEIARALLIEPSTVKAHVHNILGKYNVCRRSEAAARFRGRKDSSRTEDPETDARKVYTRV